MSSTETLKVGIASPAEMKARTMAIASGEMKPAPGDPAVWFTSLESFAKIASNKDHVLLKIIGTARPSG